MGARVQPHDRSRRVRDQQQLRGGHRLGLAGGWGARHRDRHRSGHGDRERRRRRHRAGRELRRGRRDGERRGGLERRGEHVDLGRLGRRQRVRGKQQRGNLERGRLQRLLDFRHLELSERHLEHEQQLELGHGLERRGGVLRRAGPAASRDGRGGLLPVQHLQREGGHLRRREALLRAARERGDPLDLRARERRVPRRRLDRLAVPGGPRLRVAGRDRVLRDGDDSKSRLRSRPAATAASPPIRTCPTSRGRAARRRAPPTRSARRTPSAPAAGQARACPSSPRVAASGTARGADGRRCPPAHGSR